MTEAEARKVQLRAKIELLAFSLSQTRSLHHTLQLQREIERTQREIDILDGAP